MREKNYEGKTNGASMMMKKQEKNYLEEKIFLGGSFMYMEQSQYCVTILFTAKVW